MIDRDGQESWMISYSNIVEEHFCLMLLTPGEIRIQLKIKRREAEDRARRETWMSESLTCKRGRDEKSKTK